MCAQELQIIFEETTHFYIWEHLFLSIICVLALFTYEQLKSLSKVTFETGYIHEAGE